MEVEKFKKALDAWWLTETCPELKDVSAEQLQSLWDNNMPNKTGNPISKEAVFAIGLAIGVRLTGGK